MPADDLDNSAVINTVAATSSIGEQVEFGLRSFVEVGGPATIAAASAVLAGYGLFRAVRARAANGVSLETQQRIATFLNT